MATGHILAGPGERPSIARRVHDTDPGTPVGEQEAQTGLPIGSDASKTGVLASALGRADAAGRAGMLRRLQRSTGNAYVQQVVREAQPYAAPPTAVQRDPKKADKDKEPPLLTDFAAKFAAAAEHVRKSDSATKLVTVYVPKSSTDPVVAMRDFLFELNNAIRQPQFAKIHTEAVKGSKGGLTAETYAYKMAELEVEGMLRLGEVWFETKKTIGKGAEWNKYDNSFFHAEYKAFKDKKKSKDDIVKEVLKRVYDTGTLKGKTVEQYYMEHYKRVSGGK